jgi:hypothetical protein
MARKSMKAMTCISIAGLVVTLGFESFLLTLNDTSTEASFPDSSIFKFASNDPFTEAFALSEPGATAYKIMDDNSEGWFLPDGRGGTYEYDPPEIGYYLKRVNGEVLAKYHENFLFEPASSVKALYHFHAMKQVEEGTIINGEKVTLMTPIPNSFTLDGTCPKYVNLSNISLKSTLKWMMQNSDNLATLAVQNYFGLQNIYETEYDLGMSQTTVVHTMGCGGPPQNTMTLVEAGKLYEGVATGYLSDRATAFSLMLSPSLNPVIAVQDLEFNSITHPSVISEFNGMRSSAAKAGDYDYGGREYTSVAGWASLPFKDSSCNVVNREYVYGAFIHSAFKLEKEFSIWTIPGQLLSLEIHDALQSWKVCEIDAKVVAQRVAGPGTTPVLVNQNIKFDVHVGVEAEGVGIIPEAIVLSEVIPSGGGIEVKEPIVQSTIYDLQANQHHSITHTFTLMCKAPGTQSVKFVSTVHPQQDLLPMSDLDASNNSKDITIGVNCVKLSIFR